MKVSKVREGSQKSQNLNGITYLLPLWGVMHICPLRKKLWNDDLFPTAWPIGPEMVKQVTKNFGKRSNSEAYKSDFDSLEDDHIDRDPYADLDRNLPDWVRRQRQVRSLTIILPHVRHKEVIYHDPKCGMGSIADRYQNCHPMNWRKDMMARWEATMTQFEAELEAQAQLEEGSGDPHTSEVERLERPPS